MRIRGVPLVTLVALLAACGGAADPQAREEPTLPAGRYAAVGLPEPFAADDRLSLRVADGEVSFQATCNTMSGTASLVDDRLVVDSIGGTEMGCDDPGAAQDRWLVDFFGSRPALVPTADGFDLRGEGVTLSFGPPDDVDHEVRLQGAVWLLTGIERTEGDRVSMEPAPAGLTATLEVTGTRIVVETGCNTASGSVRVGEGTLDVGDLLVSQRACPGWSGREGLQLAVLRGDPAWTVDGERLRLVHGDVALLYEPRR